MAEIAVIIPEVLPLFSIYDLSAEYILSSGNREVILCERGIRTFETFTRNTLDISAVPVLKKLSHLPVIIDPSHATGKSWLVDPLSKAAMAVGADGLMIEVHNDPAKALCDGPQSLKPAQFATLMDELRVLAKALNINF
jgi:3-deoxy-7-phosphoheptulonate synthase